ncbi:MAG: pilus assembly protein PilX [Gammaproteobacteria bacterium]|nr:pilus assembly protein PilX [Gammaproteobacteria bacterium]
MKQTSTHIALHTADQQRGSVLLISLIVLLVMTLLGLSSMRTTVLEEKMAGNMRDSELAFQSAEAALRDAEQFIETNIISTAAFDADGNDGLYNNNDERLWKTIDWSAADSLEYADFDSATTVGVNVTTAPRYVIQHLVSVGNQADVLNQNNYGQGSGAGVTETFLITVRGTGGSDSAVVYLQSTYGKTL